jgi:hypothetical protein
MFIIMVTAVLATASLSLERRAGTKAAISEPTPKPRFRVVANMK